MKKGFGSHPKPFSLFLESVASAETSTKATSAEAASTIASTVASARHSASEAARATEAHATTHATTGFTGAEEVDTVDDVQHGIAGNGVVLVIGTSHVVDGTREV